MGFSSGSDGKESAVSTDTGSIPGLGRSLTWLVRREWQPTPVFLPTEFHGQRILVGYSPWVPKESDMTEKLTPSLLSYTWIPKPVTCKGNGVTVMGLGKLHPHKTEIRLPTLNHTDLWTRKVLSCEKH